MTDPQRSGADGLIARLEAATEGSRELDAMIHVEVAWLPGTLSKEERAAVLENCVRKPVACDGCGRSESRCPPYTTSLDAALTLVPEIATTAWSISQNPDRNNPGPCGVVMPDITSVFTRDGEAFAATPALALCIAALKARSQP